MIQFEWAHAGPYIAAFIAAGAGWLTTRIQHRGKPENALIDQMQEEMTSMRADISGLKVEQQKAKRRELLRDDYINKLRRHIESQLPPPAPEWPEGLYD